jgi:hypothetical protein
MIPRVIGKYFVKFSTATNGSPRDLSEETRSAGVAT